MQINENYYEQSKSTSIAYVLSGKLESRKALKMDYDYLFVRKDYTIGKKKRFFDKYLINILLGLLVSIILGCVLLPLSGIILFLGIFLFQTIKYFCSFQHVGDKWINKFDLQLQDLEKLIKNYSMKMKKMDAEIEALEKELKIWEEKEQICGNKVGENFENKTDDDTGGDTESNTDCNTEDIIKSKFGFALKQEEEEVIDKKEVKRDLKSCIANSRRLLEEQYNLINECRHNIIEIDNNFDRTKKEILIFLFFIAVMEVASLFVGEGLDNVIGLCSFCVSVFLLVMMLTKYKESILSYMLEHNDEKFKGYIFCNDIKLNAIQINQANEKINGLKKQIEEDEALLDNLRY